MAETQNMDRAVIHNTPGNFDLDQNVIEELPKGCRILEAMSYGTAAWTRAARITVQLPDETVKSYFLKCATEDQGRLMIEGDFESIKAIESYDPSFVPRPCAWSKFKHARQATYFFLMEFMNHSVGVYDPPAFCSKLANLHESSRSPTGKFGFHVTTCQGPNWQNTEWHDNWCAYFIRLLEQFFHRDIEYNGPWKEYEEAFENLKTHVIPQILEPLQADGRVLKPCLIHGNMWEENGGTNLDSGQPVIFDPAAQYAHNEFELGMWRREIVRLGRPHIRQYLRCMPPSEPREQWDDRHRLYSIKYDLSHSIALPDTCQNQRELIMENMSFLIERYSSH